MALFDEDVSVTPAPNRLGRGARLGTGALAVALLALGAMTFLPTAYVIEQPGPVYNTLGSVTDADGNEVPLIEVSGAQTYPTAGALDLLTVQIAGTPERRPTWFELALAWFDPSRAIVPLEAVFPSGQTSEQRSEQNSVQMVNSQHEATAAALRSLGYEVPVHAVVGSITEGSAADGVLQVGDIIISADGEPIADASQLRTLVQKQGGSAITLEINRAGQVQTVEVTPTRGEVDGQSMWLLGVSASSEYDFPIDVTIQLDNVGGPSAGMMFALGIIDTLTPGELNGGADIAGTGTINAEGQVGAIGGIQQKLWGARDAGAQYFLAPTENCDEVVGHIPPDLQVFAVATLDDALSVLDTVRGGGDLSALPTCR